MPALHIGETQGKVFQGVSALQSAEAFATEGPFAPELVRKLRNPTPSAHNAESQESELPSASH